MNYSTVIQFNKYKRNGVSLIPFLSTGCETTYTAEIEFNNDVYTYNGQKKNLSLEILNKDNNKIISYNYESGEVVIKGNVFNIGSKFFLKNESGKDFVFVNPDYYLNLGGDIIGCKQNLEKSGLLTVVHTISLNNKEIGEIKRLVPFEIFGMPKFRSKVYCDSDYEFIVLFISAIDYWWLNFGAMYHTLWTTGV